MDINIDAYTWKNTGDFYHALLSALGAPEGHGHSIDALIDSMIWGGMNAIDPPYRVRVVNTKHLPHDLISHIRLVKHALAEGREYFRNQERRDVDVEFEIVGDQRAAGVNRPPLTLSQGAVLPAGAKLTIDLDATAWKSLDDLYTSLLGALGAPEWHGTSIEALIDSMIWGGINAVDPPYKVRIFNTERLSDYLVNYIMLAAHHLADACKYFRKHEGHDIDVEVEIVGDPGAPCELPATRAGKACRGVVAESKYVIQLIEGDDGKLAPRRSQ